MVHTFLALKLGAGHFFLRTVRWVGGVYAKALTQQGLLWDLITASRGENMALLCLWAYPPANMLFPLREAFRRAFFIEIDGLTGLASFQTLEDLEG